MSQTDPSGPCQPDMANGSADPSQAPEIWDQALKELRHQMTGHTFHSHLSGSWPLDWDPSTNSWIVGVRRVYSLEWLRHRLNPVVQRALAHRTPGLPKPKLTYIAASPPVTKPTARRGAVSAPGAEAGHRLAGACDPDPDAAGAPVPGAEAGARQPGGSAWADLQFTDIYIKLKVAFRQRALRRLKGAKLAVFLCLILHMDRDSISAPGIERIMRETGLARTTVCSALDELVSPSFGLVEKMPAPASGRNRGCIRSPNSYRIRAYAWFGTRPAPALFEEESPM